jgi:hypothetical protein
VRETVWDGGVFVMGEEREMTMEGEYIWREASTVPMTTGQEGVYLYHREENGIKTFFPTRDYLHHRPILLSDS